MRTITLRLTMILLFALPLVGCDDDDGGGTDTSNTDTSTADTVLDTSGEDTSADTVPEDTDTAGDTEDTSDTGDDTTPDGDDVPDTNDIPDVDDTCTPACGANQTCSDPLTDTCVCEAGFADCDGDVSNGCETATDTAEHCGSCDPGAYCDVFGIQPVCDPGLASCDPTMCKERYLNLDGVPETGCETGFVRLQPASTDLSGAIASDIDQLVVDQNGTLFALEIGTTVELHAIEVDEQGVPSVADSIDTLLPPGVSGRAGLAAWDGFVAVARGVQLLVYEYSGGQLVTVREQTLVDALSVTSIEPQLTGSRAEFVAGAAGGLTWYAVFDKGSEPTDLICNGDAAASVTLCTVTTAASPTNVELVDSGQVGSVSLMVAVGDAMQEREPDAGPPAALTLLGMTGDSVASSVRSVHLLPNNRLGVLDSDQLTLLDYGLNPQMRPESRTESLTHTLGGPTSSLAVLDADRLAIGTDQGVEVVLINQDGPKSGMLNGVTSGATALTSDGVNLYVATGNTMSVWQLDLGPL